VRKEFKATVNKDTDYDNELRNLNILNQLRHPNIIELLASYTHKGEHNFIFPFARDGDLAALLARKERPVHFQSDESFFVALCGLSSAIEKVHYFTSESLSIELIGCHHDLKPQNILVQQDTFILADFGLSKLKNSTESSKTTFQIGAANYLAPECEDCENGFTKHTISRPSDIWSFGCIIAEILTYMSRGADGVAEFKRKRAVKVANFKIPIFHAGSRAPNLGVTTWLSELEDQSDESSRMLVQLVRSMLSMNPEDRPNARDVTSRLCFIAVDVHVRLVDDLYRSLSKTMDSFEAYVEWERFKSWRWTFASVESEGDSWNRTIDNQVDLMSILNRLINIREELKLILSRCQDSLSPLFVNLCLLNDRLLSSFSAELQARTKSHFELVMVNTEDSSLLEKTQKAFEGTPRYERVSKLASIKRMSILAAERLNGSRSSLRLDSNCIHSMENFEDHTLAVVAAVHDTSERRVLVEWIRYDGQWESHSCQQLFERVEAIADLLNRSAKPDEFRVLHCSAFFHDPSQPAFGLVYDFPCASLHKQNNLVPRTLSDILKSTATIRERPSLGDRFRLAHILAVSIFEFHKVGWLHKSISAYNVVFFTSKGSKAVEWLKTPYITGFNHSRQDDPTAFTVGPGTSSKTGKYHHPLYSMNGPRYQPEFDYYSLGIVLLEIGLWKTIDGMTKAASPSQRRDELCNKRVPLLGHYMGTEYQDAVLACLTGVGNNSLLASAARTTEEITPLNLGFERRVIEPLSRCYASDSVPRTPFPEEMPKNIDQSAAGFGGERGAEGGVLGGSRGWWWWR